MEEKKREAFNSRKSFLKVKKEFNLILFLNETKKLISLLEMFYLLEICQKVLLLAT